MNADFTAAELAFQAEVREFLANEFPAELKQKVDKRIRLSKDEIVGWQKILHKKGWMAVNWPQEFGGTGWTATQKYIFSTEMGLVGAPEPTPFGVTMVAPVIMAYGSEEQKQRFLPDILESNVWWCQGYSEPNAGSDLASLKTMAVRDGDDYVVNGNKTWNTYGQYADWIFCLVRTDRSDKHKGISFLLYPMEQPGVEVRPIAMMSGESEFNETFFTDARTPKENVVGQVNGGWGVAMTLLGYERGEAAATTPIAFRSELDRLFAMAKERGVSDDPVIRQRLAEAYSKVEIMRYMGLGTLTRFIKGATPGPSESLFKLYWSEYHKAVTELAVDILGADAMWIEGQQPMTSFSTDLPGSPNSSASWVGTFYNARAGDRKSVV